MKTVCLPFIDDMISEVVRLLATRHVRNHAKISLLPTRFEDQTAAKSAFESIWKEKLKGGYAAFRDGQMVAYLIGETSTNPWGRSGHVYLPGYAVAPGEDVSILQDLYVRLGEDWVKTGHFHHYLYISAADEDVIKALFDIGFGKERVDALLDLTTLHIPDVQPPANITIRQAGAGDNERLGSLSSVIFRALASAPYWHPTVPEDWEDLREGWSELANDKEWTVWMALENEQALGTIGFCAQDEADTNMLISPQTSYLSVAATQPHARGRGINTALTWHGLKYVREQGYQTCYTNWISPNLLASRFWPRFGFVDAAYRLSKKVNPMISWAR